MTDWSSGMIRNFRHAGKDSAAWLGDATRDVVAAWLVLFMIVAAGLSFFAVHRYGVVDCAPMLAMPGAHHHLVPEQAWDEPMCSIGSCDAWQAARQPNLDDTRAAEAGEGNAPIYFGSSVPASPRHSSHEQDELC
jgi:hypothetical protein